eukprot:gene25656-34229_t
MTGDISISLPRIVLIAGFEAFNLPLYRRAAAVVSQAVPSAPVQVFTDIDLESDPVTVENALRNADVVLMSLIFDYNQVEWLRKGIQSVPTRFCFESALELMAETSVGSFQMKGSSTGPPAPVKAILQKFGHLFRY